MSEAVRSKNVLDPGVVEARGFGDDVKDEIAQDIEKFLNENAFGFSTELRCISNIFAFVTALPCPSNWARLHPGFLMKGMCYFPVLGSLVGFLVSQVFDCCILLLGFPAEVAVAFSIAASLKITGCFHEDGLADSADGMGGGWTTRQILQIMSDSRLGTFGSAALILYLVVKVHTLTILGTSHWEMANFYACEDVHVNKSCTISYGAGPALVVAHTLARSTAPYLIWRCNYIEEDGPKSNFYSFMIRAKFLVSVPRILFSFAFSYGLATLLYGPVLSTELTVVVWACAECAGSYGRSKLGGVMGDFLGATICVAELLIYSYLTASRSLVDFAMSAIQLMTNILGSSSFEELENIMHEEKLHVFVRFSSMAIIVVFWYLIVRQVDKSHRQQESIAKDRLAKEVDKTD